MDAVFNIISPKKPPPEPDLNKPEDVRRVIETVEPSDGIAVEELQTQLSEIAQEKAAARSKDVRKKIDPSNVVVGSKDTSSSKNAVTVVQQPKKNDSQESNPYLEKDNFTAFFD